MLPRPQAFGWVVLATEAALVVLLLTGTLVRLAALLGIAHSLAIALCGCSGGWSLRTPLRTSFHLVDK